MTSSITPAPKKRGPGRPPKVDYGWNYVLFLAKIGMTDVEIQEKLKMSRSTWFRYLSIDSNREMLEAIRIAGKDDVIVAPTPSKSLFS
jgi:hypothetical protein